MVIASDKNEDCDANEIFSICQNLAQWGESNRAIGLDPSILNVALLDMTRGTAARGESKKQSGTTFLSNCIMNVCLEDYNQWVRK